MPSSFYIPMEETEEQRQRSERLKFRTLAEIEGEESRATGSQPDNPGENSIKRTQESLFNSRLPITDPERLRQMEEVRKLLFGKEEIPDPKTKAQPAPSAR